MIKSRNSSFAQVAAYVQQTPGLELRGFIPFIQERDSMNRLILGQHPPRILNTHRPEEVHKPKHKKVFTIETSRSPVKQRSVSNQIVSITHRDQIPITQSPVKTVTRKESLPIYSAFQREPPQQQTTINFKLPLVKQREYYQQFLRSNKNIADVLNDKQQPFTIDREFENRITIVKKHARKMRAKFQNWQDERGVKEHREFLKDVADNILSRKL